MPDREAGTSPGVPLIANASTSWASRTADRPGSVYVTAHTVPVHL